MKTLFTFLLLCLLIFLSGTNIETKIKYFGGKDRDDTERKKIRQHSAQTVFQSAGDEFLIDKSSGFFRAPEDQQYAVAAFDGKNYFVVWSDERNVDLDIYGARVTKDGVVLDSSGIAICTASDYQQDPRVAFGGTNYLVVWTDLRSGYPDYNIYGARVSTAGVLLDSAGIPISNTANLQESPSVVFDGTNYFVVWHDLRDGSNFRVYGARVSQSGTVVDTAGLEITKEGNQNKPAVGFDGTIELRISKGTTNQRFHGNPLA